MAKRILIVDDEADLREIIAFDLNLQGFQTVEAENGKTALEICKSSDVDLIISDLRMPGGDGMQLLRDMRKRDPWDPPVLLITGFSDVAVKEAYASGAAGLLAKPFERAEILRAVKRSLLPIQERIVELSELPAQVTRVNRRMPSFASLKKGLGGFSVLGDSPSHRIGEPVTFKIEFDSEPGVSLEGAGLVRVASEDGMGIEIEGLRPSSRERYLGWLSQEKPLSYIPVPGSAA